MKLIDQFKAEARRFQTRTFSAGVPAQEEIEQFGADGEDVIYRILREEFDCVIRGVVIPHKNKYLEKDFLVLHRGVPIVLEIKNWKGSIGCEREGGSFYQDKSNGTHKVLKSPVGTTQQFVRCMKEFYGIERTVFGMVIFAEPDCVLQLPESMDGISLVPAAKMLKAIQAKIREGAREKGILQPQEILRCTRIYSRNSEFCKGLLADRELFLLDEFGNEVRLNTDFLRYIRVEPQPLRMRDRLLVTYSNGATDVFYNRDTVLSFCCLDGTCRRFALNKLRYLLF